MAQLRSSPAAIHGQNLSTHSMSTRHGSSSFQIYDSLLAAGNNNNSNNSGLSEPEELTFGHEDGISDNNKILSSSGVRVHYVSPERRERFEFRRLISIACGILGCCSIGAIYAVSILSNGIQRTFGMSQENVTTIISAGFVMAFIAWPAGYVMDLYGPSVVIAIATALSCSGWLLFALDFGGMLAGGSVPFLSFCACCLLWTPSFFDPATMLTNLYMFPLNRGTVIIIQKTFMSLSSTVVSLTFAAFFEVAKKIDSSSISNSTHSSNNFSHDVVSGNNSSSSSSAPVTAAPPQDADGMNSEEGRGMTRYCGSFCVISIIWGLSALVGVREAPAWRLQREARNNRSLKKKQQPQSSSAPSTDRREKADADERQEEDDDAAAAVSTGEDQKKRLVAESSQERVEDGKMTRDVHDEAALLCYARELTEVEQKQRDESISGHKNQQKQQPEQPEQQQQQYRPWCTDAEWDADPRIEIALLQALPMSAPISRAALSVLGANFVLLSSATLIGVYVPDLSSDAKAAFAILANVFVFGFFLLPLLSRFVWPPKLGVRVVVGLSEPPRHQALTIAAIGAATSEAASTSSNDANNNDNSDKNSEQKRILAKPAVDEVVMPVTYTQPFFQRLLTIDCWLMWFAIAGLFSSGGTLTANSFQLFNALANGQLASNEATLNVGLMGIGGAAGRIFIGAFEQFYLTPRRYCSTLLMPLPPLLAFVGFSLMPVASPSMLWFPFFLASAAYGMSWATLLLNARQLFTVDVAQNYLFIFSAGLLSVPLSRGALGPWYDAATARQQVVPGKCLGLECVSLPIGIMAAVCFVGTILSCVFHVRFMRRNGLGTFDVVPVINHRE